MIEPLDFITYNICAWKSEKRRGRAWEGGYVIVTKEHTNLIALVILTLWRVLLIGRLMSRIGGGSNDRTIGESDGIHWFNYLYIAWCSSKSWNTLSAVRACEILSTNCSYCEIHCQKTVDASVGLPHWFHSNGKAVVNKESVHQIICAI